VVNTSVNGTKATLSSMKYSNVNTLKTVYDTVSDGKYKDVKVTDTHQLRIE